MNDFLIVFEPTWYVHETHPSNTMLNCPMVSLSVQFALKRKLNWKYADATQEMRILFCHNI